MTGQFDVFLSHNSHDKPVVEEIARLLKARGLEPWLDKWELRPGFRWQEGLEKGMEDSRAVAVFIGADGLGPWEAPEMRDFIDRSVREPIPVIPVLLPGAPAKPDLPRFLRAFGWVDLRGGVTDDGLEQLLWGITGKKPGATTGVSPVASAAVSAPGPAPVLNSSSSASPTTPARPHWKRWGLVIGLLSLLIGLGARLWPPPEIAEPTEPKHPDLYALRVQVLSPDGHPVEASKIRASAGNEPQRLPDGWWEIEIPRVKVPLDSRVTVYAESADWSPSQQTVELGTDPNPRLEMRLAEPRSWLRGVVIDASGGPVRGASVSSTTGQATPATADEHGRFALELAVAGETRVRVRAEHEAANTETYCYAGRDTCTIELERP